MISFSIVHCSFSPTFGSFGSLQFAAPDDIRWRGFEAGGLRLLVAGGYPVPVLLDWAARAPGDWGRLELAPAFVLDVVAALAASTYGCAPIKGK